jgi:limonene-1,2-epoxide hydrolase
MSWFFTLLFFTTHLWAQTMKDLSHQDKVKYFFDNFSKDKLELVDEFYHENIHFSDPVGDIHGAEKMKKYYEAMYKNVKTLRFDFSEFHQNGETVIAVWKMVLTTDKLNSGKEIVVDGNSIIKFGEDGKAKYHRDYFDMGVFVYENIPILGRIIKNIKSRFEVQE